MFVFGIGKVWRLKTWEDHDDDVLWSTSRFRFRFFNTRVIDRRIVVLSQCIS